MALQIDELANLDAVKMRKGSPEDGVKPLAVTLTLTLVLDADQIVDLFPASYGLDLDAFKSTFWVGGAGDNQAAPVSQANNVLKLDNELHNCEVAVYSVAGGKKGGLILRAEPATVNKMSIKFSLGRTMILSCQVQIPGPIDPDIVGQLAFYAEMSVQVKITQRQMDLE